jgi:hypothetical protein
VYGSRELEQELQWNSKASGVTFVQIDFGEDIRSQKTVMQINVEQLSRGRQCDKPDFARDIPCDWQNSVCSTQPTSIGQWTNLEYFGGVSNNELAGTIPKFIGN